MRADNWEDAKQVAITPDMLKGKWMQLPEDHTLAKRFRRNMPVIHQAIEPGSRIEFSFTGTTASVFDLLGPDGGLLQIQVDEGESSEQKRIDGYCTYHRMAKTSIANEIENTRHQVAVTLSGAKLDKREILFEKNRGNFDDHPEKYADHTWYAGSLLIIGEIVDP